MAPRKGKTKDFNSPENINRARKLQGLPPIDFSKPHRAPAPAPKKKKKKKEPEEGGSFGFRNPFGEIADLIGGKVRKKKGKK